MSEIAERLALAMATAEGNPGRHVHEDGETIHAWATDSAAEAVSRDNQPT